MPDLEAVVLTDQTMGAGGNPAGDGDLLKIRIGNIPQGINEPQIRALFLPYGVAQFYSRPMNDHTHRPDTMAFVELPAAQGAAAIKGLAGTKLGGEVITVEIAKPLASWAPDVMRGPQSAQPRRTVTPYTDGNRRGA